MYIYICIYIYTYMYVCMYSSIGYKARDETFLVRSALNTRALLGANRVRFLFKTSSLCHVTYFYHTLHVLPYARW